MQCPDCGQRHAQGAPDCPAGRVGSTVAGRYRLLRLIGAGGMGAVYEAEHLALGTRVALKTILARAARGSDAAARFEREARAVADIRHPGIVDVKDLGQDTDGSPFMVLELLEGRDTWSLLSEGPLPVDRAVWIATEALDALAVAHARGIIHRDLKPANLFVALVPRALPGGQTGERVKILDFGLAKVLEPERVALTRTGYFMGSAPYMSPEQTQDAKRVDARCDVYALGVTLFELLTGYLPVSGDSSMQMLVRVGAGEINRSPRSLRPDVPAWLDAVVARALAFEPADRFGSALEMKSALDAGAAAAAAEEDGRPTHEVIVPSGPAPTVPQTAPSIRLPDARPSSHGRLLLAGALLAVLAVGAVVLLLVRPSLVNPELTVVPAGPPVAVPVPLAPVSPTSGLAATPEAPPAIEEPAIPSLAPVSPVSGGLPPSPTALPGTAPPVPPPPTPGAPARGPSGLTPADGEQADGEDGDEPPEPPPPEHPGAEAPPPPDDQQSWEDRVNPPRPERGRGDDLPGSLTRPAIMVVMDRVRDRVFFCTPVRPLTVDVVIAGTGRVLDVSLRGDWTPEQKSCVGSAVRSLRFPQFQAPSQGTFYTF